MATQPFRQRTGSIDIGRVERNDPSMVDDGDPIAELFGLDHLPANGGIAAIGDLPGVLSAVHADGDGADAAGSDRVALKVALTDDSALTSVVAAVAERGSHLIGLAKSEPSLEDVFVELVGRGFGDDDGSEPGG